MEVGDDARVAACGRPPEQHPERVVHSLDDHNVGLELAQLTHDPERQRKVEGETVEQPWTERRDEVERVVARRLVTIRRREDAHLGNLLERVELLLGRPVERQAIPRATHEQDPDDPSPPCVCVDERLHARREFLR